MTPDEILTDTIATPAGLLGEKAYRLSYTRERLLSSMGWRLTALTEDDAAGLSSRGFYPGLDTDAVFFAWVLTRDDDEVLQYLTTPKAAIKAAMEFGERKNIAIGMPAFDEAAQAMIAEFSKLAAARYAAQLPQGEKGAARKKK